MGVWPRPPGRGCGSCEGPARPRPRRRRPRPRPPPGRRPAQDPAAQDSAAQDTAGLRRRPALALGLGLLVLTVAGVALVCAHYDLLAPGVGAAHDGPPDPEVPQPPSPSRERVFAQAAVCSDGPPCSAIGRDILALNGSAMDAALAAMFCNGVVNGHSMGLGGGFLMTYYERSQRRAYTLNAREMAPRAAAQGMFKQDRRAAKTGALAVAVPGELRGYWEAHQRFGRLPWKDIVAPTFKICEEGYNMTQHQADSLAMDINSIDNDPTLVDIFMDPSTGKYRRVGSLIKHKQLCKTLRLIAERGGEDLYTGELGKMMAEDIQQLGGLITRQDLIDYKVKWDDPITVSLQDNTLYTVKPPGSGAIVALILHILDGYKFTSKSVSTINDTILTYHRIAEAFKWAYAKRTELGDGDFVDLSTFLNNVTSLEYANDIRNKIKDNATDEDPKSYGAVVFNKDDHGTAHISVIAPNGDAVSMTSTVNLYFGAGITSKQTGIILNSAMDDFSSPGFVNHFNLPGSPANAIKPGKRPLSSMSPSIIVGSDGDVKMVVGASGGTKISTAIPYVIMRYLWFGESIKQAIDASRFHHQLFPMEISYEYGMLDQVVKGLQKIGHKMHRYRERGSIICGVTKNGTEIRANADFRKGGEVDGY